MKIASIRTYVLQSVLNQPFAFSQGWVTKRSATVVEVITDLGTSGWGEAFNQGLEPPQISAAVIEHALKPLALGGNPLDVEVLWHRMYHATRDYGRKGAVMAAISAIDIALWDIAGKCYGVPIYQLLGGAFRPRVQAYATGFYRTSGQGEAERLAEEALGHAEAGFSAMKVKLGFGLSDDMAVMHAIQRALGGRAVTLMVDTNHGYGFADALRLGRLLEPFQLRWYEEPLAPEDHAGYRELRSALNIPIAAGENEHSLYGFRELLDQRCVDIAQPDIASAGGFTACRHIIALAQAHGIPVNPHVWGSAVAQAASLQLIAAIPVAHHSVFPSEPIFEYDRSAHPFRQSLVKQPFEQVGGWIEIHGRRGWESRWIASGSPRSRSYPRDIATSAKLAYTPRSIPGARASMRIGILADIHESLDELRWASAVLKDHGADCLVVLGDVCETHRRLEETVAFLDDAGAIGVWGNHDFGLCLDNQTDANRSRYSERLLRYMGRLLPRLEIEGCLFTHVEPWLNPEKVEDLWYLEGPPETPEQVSRIFTAVPHRVMFVGHYHCWLLVSSEGVQQWSGEEPVVLEAGSRYLVVVHGVQNGKCALFDTGTHELIPFTIGRSATI